MPDSYTLLHFIHYDIFRTDVNCMIFNSNYFRRKRQTQMRENTAVSFIEYHTKDSMKAYEIRAFIENQVII